MDCKFLSNGITISYNNVLRPCCEWKIDPSWREDNHRNKTDLSNWHQYQPLIDYRKQLSQGQWPVPCVSCEKLENLGRGDSMRLNGNRAYAHYGDDDIVLEIRPGSTCNFACQTCWPAASSRVAQYQIKAGMLKPSDVISQRIDDFEFLEPIKTRIKDVVLLGGEPFYDKSCLAFLAYAKRNLNSNITMFTNGSCVDLEFLRSYRGKFTLVFSLDSIGTSAEYIRYGTEWSTVFDNYNQVRLLPNVETRVNITISVYNLMYIKNLISLLSEDWPKVVTFGRPDDPKFQEHTIPVQHRPEVLIQLRETVKLILKAKIEWGQKNNAINAIAGSIRQLETSTWNQNDHHNLLEFINKMDTAKNISIQDYCPELSRILSI